MLVRKEVIEPGVYFYEDKDTGLPRKLTVTPEKVRHYHDAGKKMLAAGLSVPVPIEHQPDSRPLSKADLAAKKLLNNGGFVKDYEMAGEKLFAVLDIQDDVLAKKLPAVRWTSPWITSFFDGAGQQWDEVIGHVALTTRPRISKQQPFPSIAAAMSFVGPLAEPQPTPELARAGLCLSLAGLLTKDDKGLCRPRSPMAFSLYSGAALDLSDVAKEKPKAKPKDGEKPAGGEGNVEPNEGPGKEGGKGKIEAPPQPGTDGAGAFVDPDGDVSIHDVLKDLLEAIGIILPEEACADNFEECLYKAAMEKVKGGGASPEPDMNATPPALPPAGGNAPVVPESPPLYMSVDQVKAGLNQVADPNVRKLIEAAFSLGEQNMRRAEALQRAAFSAAAQNRADRIERLVRKCRTPGFKDQLVAQAASATLSLGDDGKVADSMGPTLDVLEAGIRDLPALLTTPAAQLSELGHPKEPESGEMTAERRQAVLDEYCGNAHIPPLPKKAG
jgi:hypothetical protein